MSWFNNCNNCREEAFSPLAYICCESSEKVAILNLATASHVGDISCGPDSSPFYIVIGPRGNVAYVADYSRNMVLMLDLVNNELINQTRVIGNPVAIDVSPCGRCIYVVFDNEPVVQILGAFRLEQRGLIGLYTSSGSIQVTNCGSRAYVTQPDLNQTAVINLRNCRIIELLDTGENPGYMAYSPESNLLLVAGRASQSLIPVFTRAIETGDELALGGTPFGLAFTRRNRQCLVALQDQNAVAAVDLPTRQVVTQIAVEDFPEGVGASKREPLAAVSNQASSTISIIDTESLSVNDTVSVGDDPSGIAVFDRRICGRRR